MPPAAEDGRWAYEIKWDGVRAVGYAEDGQLRIMSRSDRVITDRYPELAPLAADLAGTPAVLDGELVALGESGRPSFRGCSTGCVSPIRSRRGGSPAPSRSRS